MDPLLLREIITDLSLEVRNFKRSSNGKDFFWSCVVCGDSVSNKRKARFGVTIKGESAVCNCFRCAYSSPIESYLKNYHPHLYEKLSSKVMLSNAPKLYDLNHFIEVLEADQLIYIFLIDQAKNTSRWLELLQINKIKLSKDNIRKLYKLHKSYWRNT